MKTTRRTERWYQPDSGAEWVPIVSTVVGPTVAQLAGALQPAGLEEQVGTGQSWYQPDAEVVPGPLRAARYQIDGGPGTDTPGSYPWTVGHDTATTYFRLDEPFNTQSGPETAGWYTAYDSVALLADFRFAQWTGVPVNAKPGLLALGAEGRPIPDTAAGFDGASYVFLANTNSDNATTSPFSVEAWFRTSSGATQIIVGRGGYGAVAGWQLSLTSAGAVQLNVSDGAGSASATSGNGFNDGLVHHAVGVRSGVNVAIYVDGSLRAQNNDSITRNVSTADPFTVGVRSSLTFFFTGDLDEVAFYSGTALSAAQVEQHYLLGTQGWAPMVQQPDWSESAPNGQQWFAPDAEVFGIPPFAPSVATVAQQAGVHQPGHDEQADHSQFWFAPEELFWVPIPGLTQATVARQPIQQPDPSENTDRTVCWFAPEEMGFWVPIPGLTVATVAQEPIQVDDPSEQVANGQQWYQPDTGAEFVQFVAPTVLTTAQLAGLWQEQPGQEATNAQSWFAPEEAVSGIPPFAPSSATTAQQAGVHQPDPSEQVSRVATWYQPDTGAEFIPQTYAHVSQDIVEALFADPAAAGRVSQDIVEVLFQLLPDPPFFDWTDHSQQFWNYPFWFQDETQAWAPFTPAPPAVTVPQQAGLWQEQVEPVSSQPQWFAPDEAFWVPIPGLTQATTAQFPVQQPSADEEVDRTQTWFQLDAEQAWVPLANPSSVTVAQEAGLWQEQPYPESGNQQQWFAPDESFWVSLAAPSNATVAQEPIQQPSVDEDVDRTVRWYQEPDDTLGIPPFAPSVASVAQQALWSEPQPDEQVDHSQRWYQEPDDQLGAVPIIITTATVAQQAPVWYEQPGQEASLQPTWFAPESEWTPIPNLTEATVAQEPIQVAGDDEQLDRTARWFQPDAEQAWVNPGIIGDAFPLKQVDDWSESASNAQQWFAPDELFWVPLANPSNATTAQEPIQQPSADEELDHSLVWFAPDEMAPWVPIPNLTVATTAQFPIQQPGADETTDRTQVWFAPDAEVSGIPPFQPSSATVAQQAGLWIDGSGQQDASIAQLWFQDEHCQWLPVFATFTIATVPQQAPLWIEQPVAWNDGTPWFSPEESFDGFPPRVNAPTHPDYGWDAQQDRDLTQTWFTPDVSVEGLTPRVNAYTGFDIGWDAQFDVDLTQRWFSPEELLWTPEPFETEDTFPWKQEDDPSEQIANGQQWFQLDEPFTFTPFQQTVAQYPIQTDDLSEQADRTSTWFTPDTEQWTPIPGLTQATTAQEPIQQPSVDEDVDRTVVWFQPDAEQAWTPNPGQSQATVAQQPIQQPDWTEAAPNGQAWFSPDEQVWTPQAVQPTQAAIPQVDDWSEQASTAITWFTPEEQVWTPRNVPPTMPPPPQVDDPSEQVANQPTWFQDEHLAWVDEPNLTEDFYPLKQVDSLDEQADRTQLWFQDEHSAWVPIPGLTQATVPQQAALWPEQPGQEASLAQTWFTPDDAYENPLPLSYLPPTTAMFGALGQQPDITEQRPNGQQWFSPAEQEWVGPINLTQPTVAQRAGALQAYERVEQLDLSLRWYQEPDDTLGTAFAANRVRPGRVTPTDAATSLVLIIDTSNIVIPTDQPANFVTPTDQVSGKVVASDAATLGVVASDTD